MLLGRDGPQARVCGLLDAARGGRSGTVLVHGEPGVGKTALLDFAREEARDMEVLSARGLESESELPFAGLHMLVAPILGEIDALSAGARAALRGALSLGPPSAADRFAVYVAMLELLGVVAEHRALLVLVDDAHWLDPESGEALAFVARRLGTGPVAMLIAGRTDDLRGSPLGELPDLHLFGLDQEAAVALITRSAPCRVAPGVAHRIADETGGNPLAIVELASLLSEGELSGTDPLDEPLPVGPRIESAFRGHVEGLAASARETLLVVAASDSGELEEITAAIRRLDGRVEALNEAEDAGLIRIERGSVHFRHPLLRSAAYQAAPPSARRAAHAALADALTAPRAAARRAWHLAAAALGPDETVAAELERVAQDARARAAPVVAAAGFEVAARLTPDDTTQARRLLEAARDLQVAGRTEQAVRLLDDALDKSDDGLRGQIQLVRVQAELMVRPPEETRRRLREQVAALEDDDPLTAAQMLIHLCMVSTNIPDHRGAIEAGKRACEVAERVGGPMELFARLSYGIALVLTGERRTGSPLVVGAVEPLLDAHDLLVQTWLGGGVGLSCIFVERLAEAHAILRRTVAVQRAAGALAFLPYSLGVLSEFEFRRARWDAAYAAATESVELADELRIPNVLGYCLSRLTQLEAARGRENHARRAGERALQLADRTGVGSVHVLAGAPLGHLDLAAGRIQPAIARLESVQRRAEEAWLGEPNVVRWHPDLIEAYVRAGRDEDARPVLARLEEDAERTRGAWAAAAAARCRGLLADDADVDTCLEAAMTAIEGSEDRFERARTQLVFGERLRRARRPADARPLLRAALETLDRLPAHAWAERARRELVAGGERGARRAEPSATADLTPQELRVALEVAEGKTNREVAAALFVTPKTVEAHLARTFKKLGVRSRAELTRRLVDEGATAAPDPPHRDRRGTV